MGVMDTLKGLYGKATAPTENQVAGYEAGQHVVNSAFGPTGPYSPNVMAGTPPSVPSMGPFQYHQPANVSERARAAGLGIPAGPDRYAWELAEPYSGVVREFNDPNTLGNMGAFDSQNPYNLYPNTMARAQEIYKTKWGK